MSPVRRTGAERREEIFATSLELFAQRGLHGVTTKMIADAAGMSEALLYRYFASKEELYTQLQTWCITGRTADASERLAQLEPNTSTLVLAVYFLVGQIIKPIENPRRNAAGTRLILSSLIDDGGFARGFLGAQFSRYVPKLAEALEAAHRAGDLVDRPEHPALRIWCAHHLALVLSAFRLPAQPVIDYGVADDQTVIEETTRFALRGLGLTHAAISRYFNPKALELFNRHLTKGE
jgi:AcrR family transcriptional regulator